MYYLASLNVVLRTSKALSIVTCQLSRYRKYKVLEPYANKFAHWVLWEIQNQKSTRQNLVIFLEL